MALQLAKPAVGPVTSPYGDRPPLSFHNGVDYGWLKVDPARTQRVVAPVAGKVTASTRNNLVGNYIIIQPADPTFKVRLMHLSSRAVKAGDQVGVGSFVGMMGDTGTSTKPGQIHVHMDVWHNGRRVNPEPYITLPYPGELAFAGISTPIPLLPEEDTMKLIKRAEGGPEWSLFHPSLRGPSELERGYIVITDPEIAKGLARTWGDGFGREKVEERDVYIGEQASARVTHDAYLRTIPSGQIAAVGPAADLNPLVTRLDGIIATLTRIFK